MGEDGAGPAGEDRSHAHPVVGEARMAYRKHTLVDAVEPPGADSGGRRAPVHSETFQLDQGDEAMLHICQPGDLEIPAPRPPSTGRSVKFLVAAGRNVLL